MVCPVMDQAGVVADSRLTSRNLLKTRTRAFVVEENFHGGEGTTQLVVGQFSRVVGVANALDRGLASANCLVGML